jgi:hypothetical protein
MRMLVKERHVLVELCGQKGNENPVNSETGEVMKTAIFGCHSCSMLMVS